VIRGIVLAAGRSRRMGEPKALIRVGGEDLLHRAVRALRDGGCAGVTIVVRRPDDEPAARVAAAARTGDAHVVEVGDGEQIDSLRAALRSLDDDVTGAVVSPVDLPGVHPATIASLIEAYHAGSPPIVVPTERGRRGHPVLFGRSVFGELLRDPLPGGARSVVHAHADDLVEVPVPRQGTLEDVNTPEDLRRYVSGAG
jgi:molybdenum cofactor cytidylyltransferase